MPVESRPRLDTDLHANKSAIVGLLKSDSESSPEDKQHAVRVIAGWAGSREAAALLLEAYELADRATLETVRDGLKAARLARESS